MSNNERHFSAALSRSISNPNDVYVKQLLAQPAMLFAAQYLLPDELPEMILRVSSLGEASMSEAFLIATSQRLFYSGGNGKGLLQTAKADYREFPYRGIATVQFEPGNSTRGSSLIVHLSSAPAMGASPQAVFHTFHLKEDIQRFVAYVRNKMTEAKHPVALDHSQPELEGPESEGEELVESLERLGRLRTNSLITEDEFIAAKKKLLDR